MGQIIKAYAFLAGGMIGVGLFGLPYILVKAGLVPTLAFGAVVYTIAYIVNITFADVVLRTDGPPRRLPGYVGIWLGKTARRISLVTQVFGLGGALLAYLVTAGIFLALLLSAWLPLTEMAATALSFVILSPLLLRVLLRVLPFVQVLIVLLFFATLVVLTWVAVPQFSFADIPIAVGGASMLLPYGVLLFSFWSLSLIPEMTEMVDKDWRKIRIVIGLTYGTAAVSYGVFAFMIAGVTGENTSADGLTGLVAALGDGALMIGALFAVLTTYSSYLALGLTLKRVFVMEFRMPPFVAWIATVVPPAALYLVGVQEFLTVVSVTGAVFLGMEGALALLAYLQSRPAWSPRMRLLHSPALIGTVIVLCAGGVALEVLRVVRGLG